MGDAWRGEPGASSTCGIHVSVGRTRKYTGKDTWSPVNRAQRGYPPRETARFTARLRFNVLSHGNRFFLLQPGPGRSRLLLTLQFPVGRAPGFSRIEGSVLVHLKPLVRHERAWILSTPTPFASAALLSIHSWLQIERTVFSAELLGRAIALWMCRYRRSCGRCQRNSGV